MDTERSRRLHAARVAAVATMVVVAVYVLAVVVLNIAVARRLTAQVDARLADQLAETARPGSQAQPAKHDEDDEDDAPTFVWSVTGSGTPTALTVNAPALPERQWNTAAPTALDLGGTSFRFQAVPVGSGWLVAGESAAQIVRVRDALLLPELLLGAALLVVVFAGSLIIGLRASAPLELIHRRQVEFTADASHELRTPLSVIEAEVALALSRPRSPAEYQAVLGRIAGEGGRLRHIVDDLLWLARVDDGRQSSPTEECTDVAGVAEACAARFSSVAAARGVTVETRVLGSEPARIHADPEWIDRLVGVLVDNACKYAGAGGRVVVQVAVGGQRVVLQVDDSGPGIPPEQRPMVLDRFHRGTDEPGGTGLGLAIADSVVRASNGDWSIGRSPSGGARMEVSWRRANPRRAGTDGAGSRTADHRIGPGATDGPTRSDGRAVAP
ncbi:MAG: sensor histidine kinase [Acidimicrobiales bacterium]